ncbi:hypothetical protein OG357_37420 [Streptomyces sp. NBC_01255]|uniref:hypothetical protein n=1 Tax=Streptomyces sp. NBC_01255 TaxID=2903798 RepID=UPI002E2FFC4C|nr:hypothetical protein [Streptomyces sp. NBC_01255]
MLTSTANGASRLSLWLRVREFAVPPSMIETASTRRLGGDWAGACAAAGIDVDLDLRSVGRVHGRELARRVRDDLRHLAPDLLRWHMPRIAPDGLLRPGLTIALARYGQTGPDGAEPAPHLVVRTPPAWADAGQRISLALWDGHPTGAAARHPHPRPSRRFRLDLHRHLWDARRADELRVRSGDGREPAPAPAPASGPAELLTVPLPPGLSCAVDRWAAEAELVNRAEGRPGGGAVVVRLGSRRRVLLEPLLDGFAAVTPQSPQTPQTPEPAEPSENLADTLPVLPDAATWVLPDLELLRAGLVEVDRLHPLVAAALVPDHRPTGPFRPPDPAGQPRLVECRGARHRIGLVDGVLAALDHEPAEVGREELLAALTGTPLPCLQAIDEAHRRPDCLTGVRERLDHGDTAGALAVVESLLGPDALLRGGALRDELEAAAHRRITYGLYRAGLIGPAPDRLLPGARRPRDRRSHPRDVTRR